MRRLLLAFILKNNGAFAGLCIFFLVVGASFHVMHGKFEQAQQCQTTIAANLSQPSSSKPLGKVTSQPASCQTLASRQTSSFSLLAFFFSRT